MITRVLTIKYFRLYSQNNYSNLKRPIVNYIDDNEKRKQENSKLC